MEREISEAYINPRLVSLWEIMKPFHPAVFLRFAEVFKSGQRPNSNPLGRITRPSTPEEQDAHLKRLTVDLRRVTIAFFEAMERGCLEAGLKASAATLRVMRAALINDPERTSAQEWEAELRGRMIDEMGETYFFSLSPSEVEYFKEPRRGWETVISRFPQTIGDIEEARKCFSLSRYAAAIYHSLQIVEYGLIDLGTFIGVQDPHSGWTAVANRLKAIVSAKYDDRTDFEKQHFAFLEQVQGTVEALKNAWRNKISHAQGRLVLIGTDFSPEIAEEILFATRAFMRRLVDGLPTLPS